jgi:thiaminase/transcriptional activator TenA
LQPLAREVRGSGEFTYPPKCHSVGMAPEHTPQGDSPDRCGKAGAPAPGAGGFCTRAWADSAELVEAIVSHPFNVSLARGELAPEIFTHYLAQDSHYLEGFARALSAAAVISPSPTDAAMWAAAARDTLVVERALHDRWLAGTATTEPSPTCVGYTSWLESIALRGPYEVLTAALLPCFWIYEHVGRALLAACGDLTEHPYREWLESYGSDDYAALVEEARAATDRAALGASRASLGAMRLAFERGTEFEWLFWDAAWRMERWPTAEWRSH